MGQISSEMQWLLEAYKQEPVAKNIKDAEKIKLSQLVSNLGFFYEKFRNAIDYNEEHLIRRNSLRRFLRRQILFIQEKEAIKISHSLIYEFIRAKYLPNDTLPETIIDELAETIIKYLIIYNYLQANNFSKKQKLIDWVIELAACEIDEQLFPIDKELAMVNFMYSKMVSGMSFVKTEIEPKEKNLQIYIAVLKTLGKADQNKVYYRLLKLHIPEWNNLTTEKVNDFCQNLINIKAKIDSHLNHPIGFQLYRAVKKQSVFFQILKEILDKKENLEIFGNDEKLTEKIKLTCEHRYNHIRGKLIGSIIRVIIYILLTKTILALVLEVPYDLLFVGELNMRSLLINIIFHPVLMLIVAITIRVPGPKNTQIILEETKKIVSGEERKIIFKGKGSLQKGSASYVVINIIYFVMFLISFGIVVYGLRLLKFNLLSGLLFIFFLTLVSFFGFRLRNLANQFLVLPRKDNLKNFVVDFLSLPIIRVGRTLSTNFAKVNIFIYILDFIIETPLKMLIEFFEKAVSFIREKREEISE
ncbi:MAG: hypothetical protein WCV92_01840 [Candidatus Buchananbacteria bacterium]